MKILIDSSWHFIDEYREKRFHKRLFSGRHLGDIEFQSLVDQILNKSQLEQYVTGTDRICTLSKKRKNKMFELFIEYTEK